MNMMLCLSFIMMCLLDVGYCLIELQSMEVVSCANKNVCHDDKNLRIVLKASTIETSEGTGSISGIITGGQTWTDSHGDWKLLESLNINIDYQNAEWEYQLEDEGKFWTKAEQFCGPLMISCSSFENHVECANKGNYGLGLVDAAECTKYAINNVEKWEASVSIESTHLNLEWDASNTQHSVWESNAEIYLASSFDTTSCYQDLSNEYYVVVPETGSQFYYFTSNQYWQDARNNFNLSVETWKRDFDCNFKWIGWHIIIPFYETDDEYRTLAGGNNARVPMSSNQLHAFHNGYIPAFYQEVMDALTGECTDLTTYTDPILEAHGPPTDLKYKVSKLGIVDHFEMTLDLDYTQFVQMPTSAPTPNPTQSPTVHPTSNPTQSPTVHPTSTPSTPPTGTPSGAPSYTPTYQPSHTPTNAIVDIFGLYEIPTKLEITSTSHLNITSNIMQQDIIESIASGLNYGREYIRLDSADLMTRISGRRLQTDTQSLLLGFTVFTTSEEDQSTYSTKLEETATYHFILSSLSSKIPDIMSIFIANVVNNCGVGTKQITIAGQRRCQSMCVVNQYYDTSSNSCTDQVEFIITTSIIKNTLARMMYFGIGVAGWILTLASVYVAYRYYVNSKLQSAVKKSSKKSKQAVEAPVYSIGSTEDEQSEYSESEFDSITRKFTASLGETVKSTMKKTKEKLSRKKQKKDNNNNKKDKKPLLDGDSNETTEDDSSSSDIEYSSESGSSTSSESSD